VCLAVFSELYANSHMLPSLLLELYKQTNIG